MVSIADKIKIIDDSGVLGKGKASNLSDKQIHTVYIGLRGEKEAMQSIAKRNAKGGMIDYRKTGMFYGGGMAKKKKK